MPFVEEANTPPYMASFMVDNEIDASEACGPQTILNAFKQDLVASFIKRFDAFKYILTKENGPVGEEPDYGQEPGLDEIKNCKNIESTAQAKY